MTEGRDAYGDMFRFPLGACVRWAESPRTRYYVYQRRWTQREILAPLVQYRFRASREGLPSITPGFDWVYEADLQLWEEGS